MFAQIDANGGVSPADPAMDALSGAADAAASFIEFGALVEQIAADLALRQNEVIRQIAEERAAAISEINRIRAEVMRAARTDPLYRPPEDYRPHTGPR